MIEKLKGWKYDSSHNHWYRTVKTPLGYIDLSIEKLVKTGKFTYSAWWNNEFIGDDIITSCKKKDACDTLEEAAAMCIGLSKDYFADNELVNKFYKTVDCLEALEHDI